MAELYAGLLMALSYLQTSWPLDRKPVPLPEDPALWPSVDVFIPTYNESLDVVKPTVLAAMEIDWPRDKLNVYILDDGRRPEFRAFAEECGCRLPRPPGQPRRQGRQHQPRARARPGANSSPSSTATTCPPAPSCSSPWAGCCATRASRMVQTPHHFYSPDPFERNLASRRRGAERGAAVLRRRSSRATTSGTRPSSAAPARSSAAPRWRRWAACRTSTVTEDCHCSLRMQKRGWHTAYSGMPLAAGLATERLSLHIGQRLRWARGMIQILRAGESVVAAGLGLAAAAVLLHGRFPLPVRAAAAGLPDLAAGLPVLRRERHRRHPLGIMAYAGPHMFHAVATTGSRLNGQPTGIPSGPRSTRPRSPGR